jgi:mRNA interferase MazF
MAITSRLQQAGFPLTMEIITEGLPKHSWVKISQVRTLAVERLGKRIARLTPEELSQAIDGLNEIIGD